MVLPEITISGEKIFEVFRFPVSNTLFWSIFLSSTIFLFLFLVSRSAKLIPGKVQNFVELIIDSIYKFIDSITGDREKTKEIFPLSATLFLLILISNLLELIPGVGVLHFLRSPSSDLNFTLALSVFSIFYINFLALKKIGFPPYLKKFLNFKNPILFFVGILELMSELTRVFSLAIRLFGNLFAGEVLLIITAFLFPYILPLPFLFLEILVGFIQALIFSSLTVIFYSAAAQTEHG